MSKGDTICGRHIPSCLLMSDLKLTPVCKNSVGDEKGTGHLTVCLAISIIVFLSDKIRKFNDSLGSMRKIHEIQLGV